LLFPDKLSESAILMETHHTTFEPCEVNSNQSEMRHIMPVPPGERITLRVGCEFRFQLSTPVSSVIQVYARPNPLTPPDSQRVLWEEWKSEPFFPTRQYYDSFGNRVVRAPLPAGEICFSYDARVEVDSAPDPVLPDLPQHSIEELPDDVLIYTLASRYCLSDELSNWVWDQFGDTPLGWARVQAMCDWLHANIEYRGGSSNPDTTAKDVLEQRAGICRDFAHMGITLCRAMNIPARYVFGYLPDIGVVPPATPMDFHAWFEVWLGGAWRTFDARHNKPRIGRIPIARGRDAVDCAMITTYGPALLQSMIVWAYPA
jgi:transglutaminase-like putative cysteine protease